MTANPFRPGMFQLSRLEDEAARWRTALGRARADLRRFTDAAGTIYGDAFALALGRLVENLEETADNLLHAEVSAVDARRAGAEERYEEAAAERDKALRAMAEQAGEVNRLVSAITRIDAAVDTLWKKRRAQVPAELADPIADGLVVAAVRAHRTEERPSGPITSAVRQDTGGSGCHVQVWDLPPARPVP